MHLWLYHGKVWPSHRENIWGVGEGKGVGGGGWWSGGRRGFCILSGKMMGYTANSSVFGTDKTSGSGLQNSMLLWIIQLIWKKLRS